MALDAAGLGDERGLVELAWDVTDQGNWPEGHGRTILHRIRSDGALAAAFGLTEAEVSGRLERCRLALLAERNRRPQPARDDKVLAGWNGLAIAALSEAAVALAAAGRPGDAERAERYRAAAIGAATTCVDHLISDGGRAAGGHLGRSWKDGRATGSGVLEDYACLAEGLLALYGATFDERWFDIARTLAEATLARFSDPAGGFFDTADDHEILFTRPKDVQDNAVPSGNAMAATVLLRLAALTGEARYRAAAEGAIAQVVEVAPRHPTFFAQWLVALDFAQAAVDEIAIVGDPAEASTRALLEVAEQGFRPHQVVAATAGREPSRIELLGGREAIGGRPTGYVCHGFICRLPVTSPAALAELLAKPAPAAGAPLATPTT